MTPWTRLAPEQANVVLDQLSIRPDAIMFTRGVTDVAWRALPFYTNYKLLKVSNYATLPVFTMKYLSNGEEYIAVDGTPEPLYTVNTKDPLKLDETSVIAYLEFFLANVHGGDGDVFLIQDLRKTPFIDALDRGQKQVVQERFEPAMALRNALGFRVSGTFYYAGGLMKAVASVTPNGRISFEEQSLLISGVHIPEDSYLETA